MFVKYVLSGGLAFLIDLVTFLLLRHLGIDLLIANPTARLLGAATAFFLNRHWTFKRAIRSWWGWEALRYSLLWCFSTILSTALLKLLISSGSADLEAVYKIIAEVMIVGMNYLISRHVVFR